MRRRIRPGAAPSPCAVRRRGISGAMASSTRLSWHTACDALQRLDILLAAEQRALQLCEGQLFKLMEGLVEDRDAAEKVLVALSRVVSPLLL